MKLLKGFDSDNGQFKVILNTTIKKNPVLLIECEVHVIHENCTFSLYSFDGARVVNWHINLQYSWEWYGNRESQA